MSRVAERPAAASAHIRELGRLIDTERVGPRANSIRKQVVLERGVVTKRRLSEANRPPRRAVKGVFGCRPRPLGGIARWS